MVPPLHIFPLLVASALAVSPIVNVDYAQYQGTARPGGVTDWLGIRYAAPPVGNLRFAAPQDPVSEKSVQVADKHGLICIQTGAAANATTTSEDCLFLDVYAPSAATATSKLPVYFFIQGGGFNQNSNANYNGKGLIEASGMNIAVVNFNYRVGPYGFLASNEVESLNNSLLDQRKVMEWVQKYISRFGGDPDHVVMGGDAYGGRNDGLFHAVAAESQSFGPMLTANESQYAYDGLVSRAGCTNASDTLACLRNLTTTELQTINNNSVSPGAKIPPLFMYGPTIDGSFIPDYTYRLFAEGKFICVPSIFGNDTNEGTIFTSTRCILETNESFPSAPTTGKYWRQCANAYGEMRYNCPGIFVSSVLQNASVPGSWNYHYDVEDPAQVAEGYGVPHTIEVNAIWGPQYVSGMPPAS
ncbi:alpha/beta-hydrolase [Neolentinus lepideus HHB14362 ss-1]|uniref:Alpha/beta-hydrolase n=1 Tax=Neolentinus lepideus HHB14362 ss-1 TaxID=1314782 RepID=A0A165UGB5_9AGAM|nr:alpha/beta-hydrolase [Neolentinus lepideus HHB14362 ss-1]